MLHNLLTIVTTTKHNPYSFQWEHQDASETTSWQTKPMCVWHVLEVIQCGRAWGGWQAAAAAQTGHALVPPTMQS